LKAAEGMWFFFFSEFCLEGEVKNVLNKLNDDVNEEVGDGLRI
jgi:hypothetical protein